MKKTNNMAELKSQDTLANMVELYYKDIMKNLVNSFEMVCYSGDLAYNDGLNIAELINYEAGVKQVWIIGLKEMALRIKCNKIQDKRVGTVGFIFLENLLFFGEIYNLAMAENHTDLFESEGTDVIYSVNDIRDVKTEDETYGKYGCSDFYKMVVLGLLYDMIKYIDNQVWSDLVANG